MYGVEGPFKEVGSDGKNEQKSTDTSKESLVLPVVTCRDAGLEWPAMIGVSALHRFPLRRTALIRNVCLARHVKKRSNNRNKSEKRVPPKLSR